MSSRPFIAMPAVIVEVKELSDKYYVRDIVKITGLSKQMVLNIQNNPANNILNPKRKITQRTKRVARIGENTFDIDKYYSKAII